MLKVSFTAYDLSLSFKIIGEKLSWMKLELGGIPGSVTARPAHFNFDQLSVWKKGKKAPLMTADAWFPVEKTIISAHPWYILQNGERGLGKKWLNEMGAEIRMGKILAAGEECRAILKYFDLFQGKQGIWITLDFLELGPGFLHWY